MGSPCVIDLIDTPVLTGPNRKSGALIMRCPTGDDTDENKRLALWEYAQAYPDEIEDVAHWYPRYGGDPADLEPSPYTGGSDDDAPPNVNTNTRDDIPPGAGGQTGSTDDGDDDTGGDVTGGGDGSLGTAGGGSGQQQAGNAGGISTGVLVAGGLALAGVAVVWLGAS